MTRPSISFVASIVDGATDHGIQPMLNPSFSDQLTRREFLSQTAASFATAAVVGSTLSASTGHADEPSGKSIGIQVGSISFVDEGIDQVLDLLKQRGAVNTNTRCSPR